MSKGHFVRLHLLAVFAVLSLAGCSADYTQTARGTGDITTAFLRMNGSPIHRFTLTPDATTAEDNLTAAGGTAVTYTLAGGERLCFQAITTDAYVQVVAAASMASGALGFTVPAGGVLLANCLTLQPDEKKVSSFCTAAGPCLVKAFEIR